MSDEYGGSGGAVGPTGVPLPESVNPGDTSSALWWAPPADGRRHGGAHDHPCADGHFIAVDAAK